MISAQSPKKTRSGKVLKIHVSGYPLDWIEYQDAARLLINGDVVYSFEDAEDDIVRLRGGVSSLTGMTSYLYVPPILAVNTGVATDKVLAFSDYTIHDELIFKRDNMTCAYCGEKVRVVKLDKLTKSERNKMRSVAATKDHIMPQSRKGEDSWENLVTACAPCNNMKADMTPEEAGMPLKIRPFRPNRHEYLALTNKHMLPSQMQYLSRQFRGKMTI